MTQGAPSEMIETLKGQVTQLLEGVVMQDKRPLILTAIEGLTALIASGIVFQTQGRALYVTRQRNWTEITPNDFVPPQVAKDATKLLN